MIQNKDIKYWNISKEEVSKIMETDLENGLSSLDANERLSIYGYNTFDSDKKANVFKIFLRQLKSPLILVLISAGIVTFAISHYQDTVFIFIAVVVNSLLGFWQENKAERALSHLKTYLKQITRVIRDGREKEIDAEEVVPGDIIRLSQGDRVPADSRLIFVNDFQADESILTGESLPVIKTTEIVKENTEISDQSSMIFAGTLVTQGVCAAIVCKTSKDTELGKIASLIGKSENEKTPLQKAITKFSGYLSLILGFLTLIVFIIGILSGKPGLEMFLTAVAIAVSAIPEGLPISMTVILAIGVERMSKRKGVVRKLIAAEALGSTTVILTDKTGTLTEASMILSKIIPFSEEENKILSRALKNANVLVENQEDNPESWRMSGRIMEVALVRSCALKGMSIKEIFDNTQILQTVPFNSMHKFSASLIKDGDKHIINIFGAPDILISLSSLSKEDKEKVLKDIDELALSGERVLGLASKEIKYTEDFSLSKNLNFNDLNFDGLITFRDPVRKGIKHAIERVERAGIRTIIMTGDHKGTAIAVAREIGMNIDEGSVLPASIINSSSDEELKRILKKVKVVFRVTPYEKMRIVKVFQEQGEIVAMTGDGVNDAPSIKQANVGIAMGTGTEVTQDVADLVLLDDNFETIVAAVEEGRQILGNIKKVLVYLLSHTTDTIILIGGSILAGIVLPLNALQILWVNFFADSFPAVAFAFEKDIDSLAHKPNSKKMELFDPFMKFLILVIGVLTSSLLFILYNLLLKSGYDLKLVQTFTFAAFGTYSLLIVLSIKDLKRNIFSYSLFSNKYLIGSIFIGLILMAIAIYVPVFQNLFGTIALPPLWVLGVFLVGIVNIILIEIAKWVSKKRHFFSQ